MDPACPTADWLLTTGDGRIEELGVGPAPGTGTGRSPGPDGPPLAASESAQGSSVKRLDLGGKTVLPGFCDAHVHLSWIATSLLGPDLSPSRSVETLLQCLQTWQDSAAAAA